MFLYIYVNIMSNIVNKVIYLTGVYQVGEWGSDAMGSYWESKSLIGITTFFGNRSIKLFTKPSYIYIG